MFNAARVMKTNSQAHRIDTLMHGTEISSFLPYERFKAIETSVKLCTSTSFIGLITPERRISAGKVAFDKKEPGNWNLRFGRVFKAVKAHRKV